MEVVLDEPQEGDDRMIVDRVEFLVGLRERAYIERYGLSIDRFKNSHYDGFFVGLRQGASAC